MNEVKDEKAKKKLQAGGETDERKLGKESERGYK